MFTGIVREVGEVREAIRADGLVRLAVAAPRSATHLELGGSISVDGVCLTVTELHEETFHAEACGETLARTTIAAYTPGRRVNLELPVRAGQFLDGHLVQGHVDGTAEVTAFQAQPGQANVTFRVGAELAPFLAEKGSVAVNGVSLTVTEALEDTFSVSLIPTTLRQTNLSALRPRSAVNVEVDVLARYAARREEVARWPAS